jgi:hypothetical protein
MADAIPCVYLMRRADRRWKFGFSANPEKRKRALGSFFKIVQVWQTPNAWQVEQTVHRTLRPYLDTSVPGRETYKAPKAVLLEAIAGALDASENNPAPPVRVGKRAPERPPDPATAAKIAALVETYARKIEALNER